MKKDRLFRGLGVLAALVLAFTFAFGLTACGGAGGSDEDKVKSMIEKEFSSIKNSNEDQIKELMGEETIAELEKYGIEATALWNALYGRFTYEIKDVTLNDAKDGATADVKVSNVNLQTGLNNWYNWISEYAGSEEGLKVYQEEGEEGLMKVIMGRFVEELSSEDLETVENTVSIDVKKEENDWVFADEDQAFSAVFGGVDPNTILGSL